MKPDSKGTQVQVDDVGLSELYGVNRHDGTLELNM